MIIDVNDDDFIALASSSADALHQKRATSTKPSNTRPAMIIFTLCLSQLCEII